KSVLVTSRPHAGRTVLAAAKRHDRLGAFFTDQGHGGLCHDAAARHPDCGLRVRRHSAVIVCLRLLRLVPVEDAPRDAGDTAPDGLAYPDVLAAPLKATVDVLAPPAAQKVQSARAGAPPQPAG